MKSLLIALLLIAACGSRSPEDAHAAAAKELTLECSRSRLSRWNVRASAAGKECDVLLVETSIVLDDSLVEALHYGAGAYGVPRGGVQQFFREKDFRGVTYRDASARVWSYGAVSATEQSALAACGRWEWGL